MKKHKQVFGCVFIIFLLLNLLVINVIQAQETRSKFSDLKQLKILKNLKEFSKDSTWDNISNILWNIYTYAILAGYGGYIIAFIGMILQNLGFELIGYRLFVFGFRFFVSCLSVATISSVLLMILDRFILPDDSKLPEINHNHMIRDYQIYDQQGAFLN